MGQDTINVLNKSKFKAKICKGLQVQENPLKQVKIRFWLFLTG